MSDQKYGKRLDLAHGQSKLILALDKPVYLFWQFLQMANPF
jgi:hypothetical protein